MPKTFNDLYDEICSFGNLFEAARKAGLGKRHKPYVDRFRLDLERQLWTLRDELLSGAYRPGPYCAFQISEPKIRMISAAPFRDRVVHHALCNVIEPLWERRFVSESFANRKALGSSAARDHFAKGVVRYEYVLHLDFRKFFPSLDHEVMKNQFRRVVRCRQTLALMDTIVDGSNRQEPADWHFDGDELWTPFERRHGLPLGNQTSQFFANVYLDPLDHFVKEVLRCGHYARYVDDLALFARSKDDLRVWRRRIESESAGLRLRLHPAKSRVFRCSEGVTFLGVRFWPGRRRIAAENARRAKRRLRKLVEGWSRGEVEGETVRRSWRGWVGHAAQANASGFIDALRGQARRWRADGEGGVSRGPRRGLEQSSNQRAMCESQQESTREQEHE